MELRCGGVKIFEHFAEGHLAEPYFAENFDFLFNYSILISSSIGSPQARYSFFFPFLQAI